MNDTMAVLLWLLASCMLLRARCAPSLDLVLEQFDRLRQAHAADLERLVGFPSVSALPAHADDLTDAAEWLVDRLQRAGLAARLYETEGPQPVVYGEWCHAPGEPTVLIYGHYDVQPVDPLDEWVTEPFKATVSDGYVYGRGVDDDKGPTLMAVQAVEALMQASAAAGDSPPRLPLNVKFLLEGQEEIMSPNLRAFLQKHRKLLAADLCLSADGSQLAEDQGGITLGLRGITSLEFQVTTAATDMHSGMKGGSVPNANHVLAELVAGLHDPATARVLVKGFYDGVHEITEADRADERVFPFNEEEEKRALGVSALHGEAGYTTLERRWLRPTIEVVGMQGGFTGDGIKTVVPRSAFAKLACRLVPGQNPSDVFEKVREHLLQAAPAYANVSVVRLGGGAVAWTSERHTPGNLAAAKVLEDVMGSPPLFHRGGGTIPALAELQSVLGIPTTVFGWGLGEKIHAPNERIKLSMFDKGRRAWVQLLLLLGSDETGLVPHAQHDEL